jgi:hypothetical protein
MDIESGGSSRKWYREIECLQQMEIGSEVSRQISEAIPDKI